MQILRSVMLCPGCGDALGWCKGRRGALQTLPQPGQTGHVLQGMCRMCRGCCSACDTCALLRALHARPGSSAATRPKIHQLHILKTSAHAPDRQVPGPMRSRGSSGGRTFLAAALMAPWISAREGEQMTSGTASWRDTLKKGRSRKNTPSPRDPPQTLAQGCQAALGGCQHCLCRGQEWSFDHTRQNSWSYLCLPLSTEH